MNALCVPMCGEHARAAARWPNRERSRYVPQGNQQGERSPGPAPRRAGALHARRRRAGAVLDLVARRAPGLRPVRRGGHTGHGDERANPNRILGSKRIRSRGAPTSRHPCAPRGLVPPNHSNDTHIVNLRTHTDTGSLRSRLKLFTKLPGPHTWRPISNVKVNKCSVVELRLRT